MRTLGVLALFLVMALAGCSDGGEDEDEHLYTCPDGSVVDLEQHEEHHEPGFDPASLCVPPEPASVEITQLPTTVRVFQAASFSWELDLGDAHHAHSMLTTIQASRTSVPDGQLGKPESYGVELARHEHQDLPKQYTGPLNLTEAGTYYLRAYATIDSVDTWGAEHVLVVTPVDPTGRVVTVTHGPGLFLAEVSPLEVSLALGDAVSFENADAVEHTFSFETAPIIMEDVTVAAGETSPALVFTVPGTYKVVTDDVQPITVEIVV